MKIYSEFTIEPYSFLTIDAKIPASDLLRFRKNCSTLTKMTIPDQITTLDRKIKQNKLQYDLERKAAKISALFWENLGNYEYLTGENLDYKARAVEKAKFEYYPLGRVFKRGLKDEEIKEGLVKRIKNTEDKNEELLKSN